MFQIALKQSKITNVIDTEEVFDTGCYVLGPDTKFVYFQSTAHDVVESISVFTKDTITVGIQFSAHYFIRYCILMCVFRDSYKFKIHEEYHMVNDFEIH